MLLTDKLVQRFWSKVKKTDVCWLWTGAPNTNGYGQFATADGQHKAHRVAYQIAFGSFDSTLVVSQTCGNRLCVLPEHLKLESRAERRTLSPADVEAIREAYMQELHAITEIAEQYAVAADTIRNIVTGRRYVDCPGSISKLRPVPQQPHQFSVKLSDAEIAAIRERYANEPQLTQVQLAEQYGLTQGHVSAITRGACRQTVEGPRLIAYQDTKRAEDYANNERKTPYRTYKSSNVLSPRVDLTRTHCIHGHEFTPENTIVRTSGHRLCRECSRQQQLKYARNRRARLASQA